MVNINNLTDIVVVEPYGFTQDLRLFTVYGEPVIDAQGQRIAAK